VKLGLTRRLTSSWKPFAFPFHRALMGPLSVSAKSICELADGIVTPKRAIFKASRKNFFNIVTITTCNITS
jgi:hypothetical protein